MFGGGMLLITLLVLVVVAVPVVILIVAAGGGLALFGNRPVVAAHPGGPGPHTPAFSSKRCPTCGQPLQADWRVCPYDGTEVG